MGCELRDLPMCANSPILTRHGQCAALLGAACSAVRVPSAGILCSGVVVFQACALVALGSLCTQQDVIWPPGGAALPGAPQSVHHGGHSRNDFLQHHHDDRAALPQPESQRWCRCCGPAVAGKARRNPRMGPAGATHSSNAAVMLIMCSSLMLCSSLRTQRMRNTLLQALRVHLMHTRISDAHAAAHRRRQANVWQVSL